MQLVVERLGIARLLGAIVSADDAARGKPFPDLFLTAAARLHVAPVDCLVLEDSLTGVIAAKAARMAVVAIPGNHPEHDARFVLADGIVGSLNELTVELIAAIARDRA